jgi:hypothetical protein
LRIRALARKRNGHRASDPRVTTGRNAVFVDNIPNAASTA